MERCVQCVVRKPEVRRLLGKCTSWWEDNIKKDPRGRGWKGPLVDYCCLGWGKVAGFYESGNGLLGCVKDREFLE